VKNFGVVVLLLLVSVVGGCVDEQRIRELSNNMTQGIKTNAARSYVSMRQATANSLTMRMPCCDDLTTVRPSAKFAIDRPSATVSIGSAFDSRVAEFDGERSYYALFDLDGPLPANQTLTVDLTSTPGYADPETLELAGSIVFPNFRFLDSSRREIGRAQVIPGGDGNRITSTVRPPVGTRFVVVYTTKERLSARPVRVWFKGATGAVPIGGAMIVTRTAPSESVFLPAPKGSITLSMQP
jgi:hypothetical protein